VGPGRRRAAGERATQAVAKRSAFVFAFFAFIFEKSLKRDFNAVRLAKDKPGPKPDTPRLVIYSNHPSWWDAVVYVFLVRRLFASRPVFSPMEASQLAHYPFMARMGAFGVARGQAQGAIDFLATARAVLAKPEPILIVACQGRFADVREHPLRIEPGIAHLAGLADGLTFVPLAIEYVFWSERRPELLLRFGEAIPGDSLKALPPARRNIVLEEGLESTMAALASAALARDPAGFDLLLSGASGVNPIYDLWRRIKSFVSRQTYRPGHEENH
jgi:1-acyl-sn-glycerol-3-phosphate acyltransferase